MTAPNDPPHEVSIDPSDPRWVEDILDRARRRAEESRRPTAAPSPPTVTGPAAPIAPPSSAPAPIAPPSSAPSAPSAPPSIAPPSSAPGTFAPENPNPRPRPNPRPGTDTNPWVSVDEPTVATPRASGAAVDLNATTLLATDDSFALKDPATDVDPVESTTMDRRVRGWLEWGGVIIGALLVA